MPYVYVYFFTGVIHCNIILPRVLSFSIRPANNIQQLSRVQLAVVSRLHSQLLTNKYLNKLQYLYWGYHWTSASHSPIMTVFSLIVVVLLVVNINTADPMQNRFAEFGYQNPILVAPTKSNNRPVTLPEPTQPWVQ
jgi:hypothetical protein